MNRIIVGNLFCKMAFVPVISGIASDRGDNIYKSPGLGVKR